MKIPSFFTTNALQVISNAADGVPAGLPAPVATGFNNSIFSSQSDICVQLGIYGVYDGHSVLVAQCTVLTAQCSLLSRLHGITGSIVYLNSWKLYNDRNE